MGNLRLIALDIDGTLLDSQYKIHAANRRALERAVDKGAEIVLATGRRYAFAMPVVEELGLPVTLITSNGAVTRDREGRELFKDLLPLEKTLALVKLFDDYRPLLVVTFDREGEHAMSAESIDTLREVVPQWIDKNLRGLWLHAPIEETLTEDPIQVLYCGRIREIESIRARLEAKPELLAQVTPLRTLYHTRDLCLLDILNGGCSKGAAIARYCAARGIAAAETMAVGDNFNDLSMLQFAGRGYVMANGSPELKQMGWRAAPDNESGGVGWAVEDALNALEIV